MISKQTILMFLAILVAITVVLRSNDKNVDLVNGNIDLMAVICHYEAIDNDVEELERFHISPITYILREDLEAYVALQIKTDQDSNESFDDTPVHWHVINRHLTRIRVANVSLQPNSENPSIAELTPDNWKVVWTNKSNH